MSRVVMVSNRVANFSNASQWGGLSVALADAIRSRGGIWFGWDGNVVRAGKKIAPNVMTTGNVTTVTLPLTTKDYNQFYVGYSNSVLWPIFHYRLDLAKFEKSFLSGYKRVNANYAHALSPILKRDDLIWVHDYHLIPLASELRKLGHKQKIGFFLHIPFPSPEVISAAPDYEILAQDLLSYDLVGFQTSTDLLNFKQLVANKMGLGDESDTIRSETRLTQIGRFPIGIDVETFRKIAQSNESDERIRFVRQQIGDRAHIIGVDRLDYSKGIPDRLNAFRRLLHLYPDMQKKVTLTQIAPPTRENVEAYDDIREELEKLSGAINGEFADIDWTPVRYIHRVIQRNVLAALYRSSHIGIVTPLRDGMNLVAKEYIAAQDDKDPGVLVLSKFAGAAEELNEALIVNPFDVDEVAEALYQALHMPKEERIERQRSLLQRIRHRDARHWQKSFLNALSQNKMED